MQLRLIREPTIDVATMGVLFIDGQYACFTIEDAIREIPGQPVATWKVPGQTAIPQGRYRVIITPSVRFGRPLPLLLDVPGFSGIRIHPGNTIHDTSGCILVGQDRRPGKVLQSRLAWEGLRERLHTASGDIWIAVENPIHSAAMDL